MLNGECSMFDGSCGLSCLFGLFRLSGLSREFDLVAEICDPTNQTDQIDQIDKMDQTAPVSHL
jgi:hypothetical protein